MPTPEPTHFADEWVRAWTAHDIEAVLTHFRDDVVFTSPVAARVVPASGGVVRGKEALRDYWATALDQLPGLRFEVVAVYRGESTLVINYRNHRGQLVNEVLTFDGDGRVREGHGTYLETSQHSRLSDQRSRPNRDLTAVSAQVRGLSPPASPRW